MRGGRDGEWEGGPGATGITGPWSSSRIADGNGPNKNNNKETKRGESRPQQQRQHGKRTGIRGVSRLMECVIGLSTGCRVYSVGCRVRGHSSAQRCLSAPSWGSARPGPASGSGGGAPAGRGSRYSRADAGCCREWAPGVAIGVDPGRQGRYPGRRLRRQQHWGPPAGMRKLAGELPRGPTTLRAQRPGGSPPWGPVQLMLPPHGVLGAHGVRTPGTRRPVRATQSA